jgi:hypothetical protein
MAASLRIYGCRTVASGRNYRGFAGLRHAAELLRQLQQADLGFDDFLFRCRSANIIRRRMVGLPR